MSTWLSSRQRDGTAASTSRAPYGRLGNDCDVLVLTPDEFADPGEPVNAGISAKDAIVTSLVGTTRKSKDHSAAVNELGRVLAKRPDGASAERSLRELMSAKAEVEYGAALIGHTKAEALVRRARSLVDLTVSIVRLGR